MSKAGDHHYVPQFHLSKWSNQRGKISQWGRIPFNNKFVCTPVTTAATAYVPGVYSLAHVNDEEAQQIEIKLFGKIETAAKPVLEKLISQGPARLSVQQRYWWTVYLDASLRRVPHIVEMVTSSVQERIARDMSQPIPEFDAAKGDAPENTLFEWASKHAPARVANSGLKVLVDLIQSERAIDRIIHLGWLVKDVSTEPRRLLVGALQNTILGGGVRRQWGSPVPRPGLRACGLYHGSRAVPRASLRATIRALEQQLGHLAFRSRRHRHRQRRPGAGDRTACLGHSNP